MDLTAQAGLTLVVETLMALRVEDLVGSELRVRRRERGFAEFDKVQAVVLLLAAGGERVEDVRVLRDDQALSRLVARAVPSPDGLHDFLRAFHDDSQEKKRPKDGAFIPAENRALSSLARVNTELVRRAVGPRRPKRATLDLDATVIESHKRDALAHYKGGRGYQPTAVLWAEEDLVVADQFRDGNVPAGMDTKEVAQRGFAALPPSVTERFFRADSACYDEKLLKWLCKEEVAFTISADMTPELHRLCARPGRRWQLFEDRATETVALSEVEFAPGNWP
ncbi:MAG TPA: transposase, partial [Vicinamibacterales bacterium]|nr:transposase [Vicinamibacterales bacterium]